VLQLIVVEQQYLVLLVLQDLVVFVVLGEHILLHLHLDHKVVLLQIIFEIKLVKGLLIVLFVVHHLMNLLLKNSFFVLLFNLFF
jgi:hypothetical protein